MLTKEECEKALESLSTPPYESSCGGCICGVSDCGDCPNNKVLNQLIDEYFEMLNKLKTGDLSDGYHTYNELYHHRAVLFSVICSQNKELAWKSKKHHDGTMYDGMFIVGIDTPQGQYSYHYDIEPYWNMFDCKELDNAPVWDGHEPRDIDRLLSIDDNPQIDWLKNCMGEEAFNLIFSSQKEVNKWFDRMRWHVKKCDEYGRELDILKNNPPLKFEELKEGMWVWDNYWEEYFEISEVYLNTKEIDVLIHQNKINRKRYETIKYTPNRFYRKEVQE